MACPDGDSQPAKGHSAGTVRVFASRRTTEFLVSILTKMLPLPSATGNSGLPESLIVAVTFMEAASITVASEERPLKAHTVLVTGSKRMPSGFWPVGMDAIRAHVLRSKATTSFPAL